MGHINMIQTRHKIENLWTRLRDSIKSDPQRIVFPEGEDIRILKASYALRSEELAHPIVIGNGEKIRLLAYRENIPLKGIQIVDPEDNPETNTYTELLLTLRRHKGLSRRSAEELVHDNLYHGCLMVKRGYADGFLGGASRTTADIVRAGITVLGVQASCKTVSGAFIMHVPGTSYGSDGWFVFADCGVVPHPTSVQLADIAISSARTFSSFINREPRVALLSFSTRGSASDKSIKAIRTAVSIIRQRDHALKVDGELQADTALDHLVAARKAGRGSPDVAGKANVLIFPDLNAGNIAYKLTQRLSKAEAIGPILQGIGGAVNDLSRGCTVDDIIKSALITSIQAQDMRHGPQKI